MSALINSFMGIPPLAYRQSAVHLLVRKVGGQEAPGFRPIKINAKTPGEERALLRVFPHLFLQDVYKRQDGS